ncbi:MAG: hypothetical protein AAF449_05945 [Myxococcota bacterium]
MLALVMLLFGFLMMRQFVVRSPEAATTSIDTESSPTEIRRASNTIVRSNRSSSLAAMDVASPGRSPDIPRSTNQIEKAAVAVRDDRSSSLLDDSKSKADTVRAPRRKLGRLRLKSNRDVTFVHGKRRYNRPVQPLNIYQRQGLIRVRSPDLSYDVMLDYRVSDAGMSVEIDAKPWVIVRLDGISLGKTPQRPVRASREHRFSLIKPGQEGAFEVSMIWEPKS